MNDMSTNKPVQNAFHNAASLPVCGKSFEFGYTLWLILGGKDADMNKAAALLQVSSRNLHNIIVCMCGISQQEVNDKEWRQILATHYPKTWQKHGDAFNQYAAALTQHPGRTCEYKNAEPGNKNSFGYALWLVIGGENADVKEAASRLNARPCDLNSLISGACGISRQKVVLNRWPELLAEHYPEAWRRYGSVFEERLADLPERPGRTSREPRNKESFGHLLWLVLGGKKANVSKAAQRLEVKDCILSDILRGRKKPSQQWLKNKQWRKILAENYPDAWKQYEKVFDERVAELMARPGLRPPRIAPLTIDSSS
jgi:hypothetical protein